MVKRWHLVLEQCLIAQWGGAGGENGLSATLHFAARCEAAGTDGEPQSLSAAVPTHQTAALSHRREVITHKNRTVTFTLTSSTSSLTCNWVGLRHLGSIVNTSSI